MVGAPDVDQFVGILAFLEMIGEIGAEVGPASVGLLDRTILIVAELRRTEQRQFDRLPILGRFALRCLEHAIIDETVLAQPFFRRRRLPLGLRSEEHTSELQSLMRISYAVFCLKKKT